MAATARTAGCRQVTGFGSGRSRTSRSTSSAPTRSRASWTGRSPRSHCRRRGRAGAGERSSRLPASTGRSTRSATRSSRVSSPAHARLSRTRVRPGQTDHLQLIQNWGAQAGARTNHLCLDLYDLPQIPHRIAEELGGSARFVIREGECPWCRLVRDETSRPDRIVWEDDSTVAFAPFASRSPFEIWIVPRRHDADFGTSDGRGRRRRPPRRSGRFSADSPRAWTGRRTTSSSTQRRSASRSTRRTTGTGRSIRGCGRSLGWSWERACRSIPSRPRTRWRSCSVASDRPSTMQRRRRADGRCAVGGDGVTR